MPQFAANLSMLFTELPFEQRFKAAAEAGFGGVEYLFPYAWPAQDIRRWLDESSLEQVLFNLPPGDWEAGERGIASHPSRVEEFRTGVEIAIDYARQLGCSRLNCLAGLKPAGIAADQCWETLVSNLRWAAPRLADAGIQLCVEAINSRVDMPGFVLDSSHKAEQLIADVGEKNLFFQYDIYHMQIMEGDLSRTISRLLPMIGHIQFADNPGRHEPGTGEIRFDGIFDLLDSLGYAGWASAEYHPSGNTANSLKWFHLLRS